MYAYIIKDFKSKLNKNIIIIAIIGFSVTLVMGTLILHSSISKRITWLMNRASSESSIVVYSGEYINKDKINKILNINHVKDLDMQLEYNVEGKIGNNTRSLWLLGCSDKFVSADKADIIEGRNIDFNSNNYEMLVDNRVAAREGIKIGDGITVKLNGTEKTFEIVGIYKRNRFLMQPVYEFYVDAGILQKELAVENQYNKIKIITDNNDLYTILTVEEEINKEFPEDFTYETIFDDKKTAEKELSSFSMALWTVLSIFLLGSLYIIYNSFYIRMHERLKVIAMFKTIGAKEGQIKRAFVGEGILMGVIGSVIGILAGIPVGAGLCYYYTGKDITDVHMFFTIKPLYFVICLLIGIATAYAGSYMPVKKVAGLSPISALKSSVSQTYINTNVKIQIRKFILGIIMICAVLILAFSNVFLYINNEGMIYILMIVLGLVSACSVILTVPYTVYLINRIAINISKKHNKPELLLAAENITNNRNNTLVMMYIIIVGIITIISLNGMFSSARGSVKQYVDDMFYCDYMILSDDDVPYDEINNKMDQIDKRELLKDYTIVDVYNYSDENTKENYRIFAVEPENFDKFTKIKLTMTDKKLTFKDLYDNNCFVSKQIMIEKGYKPGDIFKLKHDNAENEYNIVAQFECFTNSGRLIFIDKNKLNVINEQSVTPSKLILVNKNENVSNLDFEKAAGDIFSDRYTVISVEEFGDSWKSDVVKGIEIFQVMFILITFFMIFSVINNYIVSVLERKEEMTMLSVLGARDRSISKIMIYETAIIFFVTFILGAVGSDITLYIFTKCLASIFNTDLHKYYPYSIAFSCYILLGLTLVMSCIYVIKRILSANKVELLNEKVI